jgi:hypothetical protein
MQVCNDAPSARNEDLRLRYYSPERIAGTFAAQPPLIKRELDNLVRHGASTESLKHARAGYIIRHGKAFELVQHAKQGRPERAFVFLVRDVHGAPSDIVGWMPALGWLGTWRGLAWALGQETIYKPRLTEHGALSVHQTPLGWLRDGCRGIVLLRPRLAAEFLSDAGPLLADSVEDGTHLKAALTRPAPRILVSVGGGDQ